MKNSRPTVIRTETKTKTETLAHETKTKAKTCKMGLETVSRPRHISRPHITTTGEILIFYAKFLDS